VEITTETDGTGGTGASGRLNFPPSLTNLEASYNSDMDQSSSK
tara:strand:- start:66 stop:194 length:129 start_codon:yes stop_codon:yes gene_type:complete